MCVMLATLSMFSYCYLLRFIIFSSVHGAVSLSINVRSQNIGAQHFYLENLKKVLILESLEVKKVQVLSRRKLLCKEHMVRHFDFMYHWTPGPGECKSEGWGVAPHVLPKPMLSLLFCISGKSVACC